MSKQPKKSTIRNWLRRGLSGILSLALILALLPGAVLPAQAAHWAMPYAQKLLDWGVMRGDNGNLALDRPITRAEFVAMMNRAYGYKRLGEMPFPDVHTWDWYYEDINIAYNMGYFKGASGYALPRANLTREMAAVLLTRNMMLQENVGEGLQFSDNRSLSEWSRGLVGAAADMGIIGGYSDGSFKPQRLITRGEVASMLVKAVGTMVNTKGEHDLGDVYGNVTVNTAGVTLKNGTIAGNLYLTGGIDLGDVTLENINVLGEIIVSGGGESHSSKSSVTLRNVTADAMTVDSITDQFVTLRAEGITDIGTTTVRTNAYVDDSSLPGYGGLRLIIQDGGSLLQLAGNVKEVWNQTPNSELQVVQGSANKITMDEHATNSSVLVDGDAQVNDLNLDVATKVTGEGDIKNLNVDAAGSTVEQLPDDITIRPGITSDINGSEMNSSQAAESSADPRLLAGYPKVKNIAPNSADLVFSTNKAGTVYWAVSAVSDGSVSEADLIEPPAYGGKILKSGSVKMASSNTEVKAAPALTGLTQDGSYYVSTVFVDNRGVHSPVKVTAFTTPDGTVPAFSDGPRMSRITTEVAQVTGMPNKSCQLYYALLPRGATAPTAAELKAGAVSGNLGYGTRDVVKNSNVTINVNSRQLDQETDYVVYLWLTDYDGAKSSRVYSVPFKTPDERSPIITRTRPGAASETAVEMNVTVDEAATVFWTIIPEGGENEAAFEERDVDGAFNPDDRNLQIKIENGAGSYTKNGKKTVSAANANKEVLINQNETRPLDSTKTGTSSYWMYMVAKDAAGNYSKVEKVKVQTKDDTPPQLLRQDFEPTITDGSGRPRADSNIKLVFSENVKGGTTQDKIFLKLYEEVQKAVRQKDVEAEVTARNNLAEALRDHITLYNGQTGRDAGDRTPANSKCKLVEKADGTKGIENDYSGKEPWVINYCYATVELSGGSLTVTFPTVKDDIGNILDTSALRLASGGTYHFILTGIRDNSVEANELVAGGPVTEVNSTMQVQYFTTKFGTVKMEEKDVKESLGEGYYKDAAAEASKTETPFTANSDNNPTRIDYHFTVTPETVQGMGAEWFSDMLLAADTSMKFTLYKRTGTTGVWTRVGSAELSVPSGSRWAYKSVSWWFPEEDDTLKNPHSEPPTFTAVKDMAPYTEYAIHVDELAGEDEYKRWSGPVTMTAYVMAGKQRELAQQPSARSGYAVDYERWVGNSTDVQPIGYDVDHTANNYLDMKNPFPYQLAPKIRTESEFPNLDVYDTTANITLNLDAAGRVYWMLIPLSGLAGTEKDADGKDVAVDYTGTLTEDKVSKATSYTPENAIKTTKDANPASTTMPPLKNVPIMFGDKARAGIAADDSSDPRLGELRVEGPNERQILGETPVPWANVQRGRVRTAAGSELLQSTDIGHINLTNLKANTVYMLVMLTENESGIRDTEGAYCYRFTTEVASRPYFDLAGSGAIVTAETKGTANMHFFVMQGTQGRFGEFFDTNWAESGWTSAANAVNSDGYSFTLPEGVTSATNMTVLDAMTTKCERVVGNTREYVGSVFDVFAKPLAVSTFSDIIRSQTGSSNAYIWSTATRGTPYTITGSGNQFNCETRRGPGDTTSCVGTDMNPLFTYTIVAVAESADGTSSQMSFRAWSPLSVSDNEAPAIRNSGCTSYTYDAKGNLTSASFYVDFDEPLYAYYNNVRHPIDYCSMSTYLGKTDHCTDASGQVKANQWVSIAQLVGKTVSTVSALEVTGLEDYSNGGTGGTPPATTPTYTQYHGTPTEQTVSRVQMISFTIKTGSSVSPGTSMALLGGAGYQIADAVGNGGNNLYIKFTFTRADALKNDPPSFEIEWR